MQFQKGDMVDLAASDVEKASGRFEVLSVTGDQVKIRDRASKKMGVAPAADLRLYVRFGGPVAS
jgi:hypothetical protein